MKILQVHNHYQHPGGEDVVVAAEKKLLEDNGHEVFSYRRHNEDVRTINSFRLLRNTLWNTETTREIDRILRKEKPDVVHCHNTMPLISPSVYAICNRHEVPVVQTLHNYRYFCANGYFLYRNRVCEYCTRHPFSPMPAVWGCYRNSLPATVTQLLLRWTNRMLRTYRQHISGVIVLTRFCRQKLLAAGIPSQRIFIKPNFIEDPLAPNTEKRSIDMAVMAALPKRSPFFVFAGRLSPEKGPSWLVDAWIDTKPQADLVVLGDGPLRPALRQQVRSLPGIQLPGNLNPATVAAIMRASRSVIVPSLCYEAMPTVIIEAFGNQTPVIASDHGAMAEMVCPGETGALFKPGNAVDLSETLKRFIDNPANRERQGINARKTYLKTYCPEQNYAAIMDIYRKVTNSAL